MGIIEDEWHKAADVEFKELFDSRREHDAMLKECQQADTNWQT